MIVKILKKILSPAKLSVDYHSGDQIHIQVVWGGTILIDRTIDIMPKV